MTGTFKQPALLVEDNVFASRFLVRIVNKKDLHDR
jgi:hypothetical protein